MSFFLSSIDYCIVVNIHLKVYVSIVLLPTVNHQIGPTKSQKLKKQMKCTGSKNIVIKELSKLIEKHFLPAKTQFLSTDCEIILETYLDFSFIIRLSTQQQKAA